MTLRLLLVLSLACLLAGCGGSSDESSGQATQAQAAESGSPSRQHAPQRSTPRSEASGLSNDPQEPTTREAPPDEAGGGNGGNDSLRTWTDATGNTLAKGEFVSFAGGRVGLQTEDGRGVAFPFEQLSQADQEYVKSLAPDTPPEPAEEEAPQTETAAADPDLLVEETTGQPPQPDREYEASRREKVVIPFDFVSKFDNGRYGQMVGDSIWKKLDRQGGFVIPGSMLDVRDLCATNNRKIGPDTPLEKIREVVRGDFDADVAIWGSVERAPGAEWEIYDLVIKCADFSVGPEPRIVYEVSARTKSVSEIPHLYVKQMLDKLYDRKPGGPPPINALAEENWKKNPNLVEGGDFQKGSAGVPLGWAPGWEGGYVNQYERLGNHVQWIPEPGNPSNRIIRLTFEKSLGDSTGVPYYNAKPFPIEEGATYRFQCRWRHKGGKVKVFIKCYDEMGSEYSAAGAGGSAARPRLRRNDYIPETSQLRECYRSQQNLYGPQNTWNTQVEDFTPKQTRYHPRWGKVMLYGYLGAGVVDFDDVVIRQILPPSPGAGMEERRHSMESTVTIKEMEKNELRAAEARERLRQRREKNGRKQDE